MKRLLDKLKSKPPSAVDYLGPKGDTVQVILKRKGKPVAAIYKDDEQEIRSPALKQDDR
jgi:hypothetical protein